MNRQRPAGSLIGTALIVTAVSLRVAASTYYVDFQGGDDSNDGTSIASPWKHCPGDDSAIRNPGSTALSAGDTVVFKGGVRYRGIVRADWDGSWGKPIVYDGNTQNTFGTGRALIEGADPLPDWTPCRSPEDAQGNPNWRNLVYTLIPTNSISSVLAGRLHQDDEMLWVAQEPDLSNPMLYDEIEEFYTVPQVAVTKTTIVDPAVLSGGEPTRWIGATVIVWVQPNVVNLRTITQYDPIANKITFDELSGDPYPDRNTRYSLFNAVYALDKEGEYSVTRDEGAHYRILLWPRGSTNMSQTKIQMSVRPGGLSSNSRSHLVFRGFDVARQGGDRTLLDGVAIGGYNRGGWNTNVFIHDNVVKNNGNPAGCYAAIHLFRSVGCIVSNNVCYELPKGRGVFIQNGVSNIVVDNAITNAGRTAITFYNQTNSVMRRNRAISGGGVHANGMNVYSSSDGVTVADNYIRDSNIAFTIDDSSNLLFYNNVCISTNERCFATFGDIGGTNRLYNNLFLGSPKHNSVYIRAAYRSRFHFVNNILDGSDFGYVSAVDSVDRQNNIFLSVWDSKTEMGAGELLVTARDRVFADPAARDYRLAKESPARRRGLNLYELFRLDGLGEPRPASGPWDIGPYLYQDAVEGGRPKPQRLVSPMRGFE